MPRYLVSIAGPEQLDPQEVKAIIDHQLPDADGYTVEAVSTHGTVFASVSVFDEAMTEVGRAVQQLGPHQDGVTFANQITLVNSDSQVVVYSLEGKFTRHVVTDSPTEVSAQGVPWSPNPRAQR